MSCTSESSTIPGRIFIGGLPKDLKEDGLKEVFNAFGEIDKVEVIRNLKSGASRRYGFISFENDSIALNAMEQMDGTEVEDCRITVKRADVLIQRTKDDEPVQEEITIKQEPGIEDDTDESDEESEGIIDTDEQDHSSYDDYASKGDFHTSYRGRGRGRGRGGRGRGRGGYGSQRGFNRRGRGGGFSRNGSDASRNYESNSRYEQKYKGHRIKSENDTYHKSRGREYSPNMQRRSRSPIITRMRSRSPSPVIVTRYISRDDFTPSPERSNHHRGRVSPTSRERRSRRERDDTQRYGKASYRETSPVPYRSARGRDISPEIQSRSSRARMVSPDMPVRRKATRYLSPEIEMHTRRTRNISPDLQIRSSRSHRMSPEVQIRRRGRSISPNIVVHSSRSRIMSPEIRIHSRSRNMSPGMEGHRSRNRRISSPDIKVHRSRSRNMSPEMFAHSRSRNMSPDMQLISRSRNMSPDMQGHRSRTRNISPDMHIRGSRTRDMSPDEYVYSSRNMRDESPIIIKSRSRVEFSRSPSEERYDRSHDIDSHKKYYSIKTEGYDGPRSGIYCFLYLYYISTFSIIFIIEICNHSVVFAVLLTAHLTRCSCIMIVIVLHC